MASEFREAAIVGIGWTDFSKNSGRSELRLGLEAAKRALADAGLPARSVDGFVTNERDVMTPTLLANNLGVGNLGFWSLTNPGGGGACAMLVQAALAVGGGQAEVVLCVRGHNGRSGWRYGQASVTDRVEGGFGHFMPYGLLTPAQAWAIQARRLMEEFGTTTEQFGRVAVAARKHAQRNPDAMFHGRPLTLEDHLASRMIADPIRLLDSCLETDGGCALVVTSLERARDLRQPPVRILATAQGTGPGPTIGNMTAYSDPNLTTAVETRAMAEALFRRAGVTPRDIDVAQIYDHFTSKVLMALEALGFCGLGEGGPFVEGGRIEWPDGDLPLNTSGGQLSEAYIHGVTLILEGVRQIRGTSTAQVPNAQLSLVTSANGAPTSGAILAKG